MAKIYAKSVTNKTLILSPREYFLRPFDFGTDWTEVRMGFFFGGVTSGGDNTQAAAEALTVSTPADKIFVGLKNSDDEAIPGFAGSLFFGHMTATTRQSIVESGSAFSGTGGALAVGGYVGTSLIGGSTSEETGSQKMSFGSLVANASSYDGFFALKFVIANRGLATQTVTITSVANDPQVNSDYNETTVQTRINNGTYAGSKTLAWNDGSVAYDIPDAVFIRLPFYSNRIRISVIRVIRYAP